MHDNARDVLIRMIEQHRDRLPGTDYYDVGSFNVNGSVRDILGPLGFTCKSGLDIREGPNVDTVVSERGDWNLEPASFAVSLNTLEHVRRPWEWIKQVSSIIKPGGMLFLTSPWRWPIHRYPLDCWRVLPDGLWPLFSEAGLRCVDSGTANDDTFGVATKSSGNRFVIASCGRDGSTWLSQLIHSHPQLTCYGELFVHHNRLDELAESIVSLVPENSGFKLVVNRPEMKSLTKTLGNLGYKFILLQRRNLLRQALSFYFSNKTGIWSIHDDNFVTSERIVADVDWLANQIEYLRNQYETVYALTAYHERLHVYYEDMQENVDKESRRVLEFLGVQQEELTSTTKQQERRPLNEIVSNYDDVRARFPEFCNG